MRFNSFEIIVLPGSEPGKFDIYSQSLETTLTLSGRKGFIEQRASCRVLAQLQ